MPPDVFLIGDAAHAIVPFHGQGMNCGFEDCMAFVGQLDECREWSSAAARFAAQRKPNADAIAQMALENYITMRDSVRDPKFQLCKQLEFELELKISRSLHSPLFHGHVPSDALLVGTAARRNSKRNTRDLDGPRELS